MSNNKVKFFKNASDIDIKKYFGKLGKIALLKGGKYNDIYLNDIKLLNKYRQKGGFIWQTIKSTGSHIKKAKNNYNRCSFGTIGQGQAKAEHDWSNLEDFLNKNGFSQTDNDNSMNRRPVNRSTRRRTPRNRNKFSEVTIKSSVPLQRGSDRINISNYGGLKIGQTIVIGEGSNRETRTIIGFGSIILDKPLEKNHPIGTLIKGLVSEQSRPSNNSNPTTSSNMNTAFQNRRRRGRRNPNAQAITEPARQASQETQASQARGSRQSGRQQRTQQRTPPPSAQQSLNIGEILKNNSDSHLLPDQCDAIIGWLKLNKRSVFQNATDIDYNHNYFKIGIAKYYKVPFFSCYNIWSLYSPQYNNNNNLNSHISVKIYKPSNTFTINIVRQKLINPTLNTTDYPISRELQRHSNLLFRPHFWMRQFYGNGSQNLDLQSDNTSGNNGFPNFNGGGFLYIKSIKSGDESVIWNSIYNHLSIHNGTLSSSHPKIPRDKLNRMDVNLNKLLFVYFHNNGHNYFGIHSLIGANIPLPENDEIERNIG